MTHSIKINIRNVRSKFVALDVKDRTRIIAEGRTAESAARKARKCGKPFSMMFVPARGRTYVF